MGRTLAGSPGSRNIASSLVAPQPPVRRFTDAVRRLVHLMALSGFEWQRADRASPHPSRPPHLEALGRSDPEGKATRSPVADLIEQEKKPRRVSGKYPNHTVLIDITDTPGFLRLVTFKLVVVLDIFLRMPLAWRVFSSNPTAIQVTALVEQLAKGADAKHRISDQGTQFTAHFFQDAMRRLGIRTRFGANREIGFDCGARKVVAELERRTRAARIQTLAAARPRRARTARPFLLRSPSAASRARRRHARGNLLRS